MYKVEAANGNLRNFRYLNVIIKIKCVRPLYLQFCLSFDAIFRFLYSTLNCLFGEIYRGKIETMRENRIV